MKICYVANAASIHTQKWAKYFADKGHDVHLISGEGFGARAVENVQLHVPRRVPGLRGGNLVFAMAHMAAVLRRTKPDILHGHYATGGGFWAAVTGFHPFVLTGWGSDILIEPKTRRLAKWKAHFALVRADATTCDAEHFVRPLVELGADPEKVALINFGIDTSKFHPGQRDEALRARLQVVPGSPIVFSLRSFYHRYDVESFIRAVPDVLKAVPDATFVAAGGGDQRGYLESLASSLRVSDRVKFIGFIANDDLPRYLASIDVYVSTALSDAGLSSSTAEAMACERAVVITDFGDNGKWVKDGEGGFLVPLRSPAIVAEKVVALLEDAAFRAACGRINRSVIQERNDYYTEMAKVERLYEGLIQRQPAREMARRAAL